MDLLVFDEVSRTEEAFVTRRALERLLTSVLSHVLPQIVCVCVLLVTDFALEPLLSVRLQMLTNMTLDAFAADWTERSLAQMLNLDVFVEGGL